MKKVFNVENCSNKEYRLLYKMYHASKESTVHNLSSVKNIPIPFRAILSLGLKFVIPKKPSIKLIKNSVL